MLSDTRELSLFQNSNRVTAAQVNSSTGTVVTENKSPQSIDIQTSVTGNESVLNKYWVMSTVDTTQTNITETKDSQKYSSPIGKSRRDIESFLIDRIEQNKISFKYMLTLSFYRPIRTLDRAENNNRWVKKLIVDFFYANRDRVMKHPDRMKFLFINEKNSSGSIHVHILMEKWNDSCINRVYNRIIKDTAGLSGGDIDDGMILKALTKHLKRNVNTLGQGRMAVDITAIYDLKHLNEYLSKSFDRRSWEGPYDHIDFMNSDLGETR